MMSEQEQTRKDDERNWDSVAELARVALAEQRRARRWGIFFKLLGFGFLAAFLLVLIGGESGEPAKSQPHTAVVDVQGMIADFTEANADNLVSGLRAAFEAPHSKGVLIRINSPGGSPVQAGYVYDEIMRLRKKYPNKPVYAVATDLCASGAYYIAAAADKIYANRASVVGSIGVLMNGFGFTGLMDKLGIQRRLYTAGKHKGFLDPFSPEQKGDVQHINRLLEDIHRQFIAAVKRGRGDRLKEDPKLFSGLVWTGDEAVKLGLVDGLGSPGYVAREVIGAGTMVDYTPRRSFLERFANNIGASFAGALEASLNGITLR